MRKRIVFLIVAVFMVGIAAFVLADGTQGELAEGDSGAPLATIEPRPSFPQSAKSEKNNEKEVPIIFEFILESDYVLIANPNLDGFLGLVKRDGPQPGETGFNHGLWSGYAIYSMNVQSLLFSKEMLEREQPRRSLSAIDILEPPLRGLEAGFVRGSSYLLFVEKVPQDEDVFSTLNIDTKKTYHRVVIGNRSLFYDGSIGHSPSKRGSIYLERVYDANLVPAIKQLCAALSLSGNKARMERLQELSISENEKLRTNAEYAIQYLSNLENSRPAK